MVNRHLFPNNFSVDQAKKSLPAIIQNARPPFPKIHTGLRLWELNVVTAEVESPQFPCANVRSRNTHATKSALTTEESPALVFPAFRSLPSAFRRLRR